MEQHIELDKTYMNIIKFGTGRKNLTIIAGVSLCGLEGLGEQIENALNAFSKDFTVYVFDRKKTLPDGYTMTEMAEDVYSCLNQLGVKKTCVYGTSQGGMISQILAIRHPQLIEKLVLCSTAAKVEKNNRIILEWKDAAKKSDIARLNRLFLDNVYSDAFKESIKDYIPSFLQQGTVEDCHRFSILLESIEDFDITDQLSKIQCPVLVICDKNDKVFEYTEGTSIAEKTGAKTIIYNQYSHAVYDEAPDLKQKIIEFCN